MKRIFLITAVIILSSIVSAPKALSVPLHADKGKVKRGCAGCHVPHKAKGGLLLKRTKEDACGKCHGEVIDKKTEDEDIGDDLKFAKIRPKDVYTAFKKSSNHPVFTTTQYHSPAEVLPETNPQTPRHVTCFDCHNVHLLTKHEKFKGLRGVTKEGVKKGGGITEAEICYKCHGDSINLPIEHKNKRLEFLPSNQSYHPVEDIGKRSSVPSLKKPLLVTSRITCSDCHGNDDQQGAKGPHGSNYAPILKYNYSKDDKIPENYYRYELCYICHDRNSILADDSFNVRNSLGQPRGHNFHIETERASCYACHNSHGSQKYKDLIDFDETIVVPNTAGRLNYTHEGNVITCYLKCHNKQHL